MVSELVGEIDYDYWKEMFLEDYAPIEDQEQWQNKLIKIVETHLNMV